MNKTGKNYTLFYSVILLLLIGLIFISVSSTTEAVNSLGDKLYYVKKQLLWSGIGLLMFWIMSKINISLIKNFALPLFLLSIFMLALILIPTFSNQTLGARRWLDLGGFGIQPSELLKLSAVIIFAKLFSSDSTRNIKTLCLYLGLPLTLIILEPNLSTAVLIAAIIITLYYTAGGEIISLFILCFFSVLVSSILILSSPYRLARFNSLVSIDNPKQTTSYHSNQMILALTSGHWTGKGFANSDQKYRFLPKISTDSILAVIGEETGFIGLSVVIGIYVLLISTIFKICKATSDVFISLLVAGIGYWLAFQSLINISAVAALIPLTGVPLPFISYGGSSLISLMSAMGIIQNIQNNHCNLIYSNNRENKKNHRHYRHSSHSSH